MITIESTYGAGDNPDPQGVSVHITGPDIETHLLTNRSGRVAGCTFARASDHRVATTDGTPPTTAAERLATLLADATSAERVCRIQPSERHGYQVCLTWWPRTNEEYIASRTALESFLREVLADEAITYSVV